MSAHRMTLDRFIAESQSQIETFVAATRRAQAEGEEGFVGDRFERRTMADWWREVAAYFEYTELQEVLIHDRRAGGTIERRRISGDGQ